MLPLLILAALVLGFRLGLSQQFNTPPPSGASIPYSATFGGTINASWSCEYENINLQVLGPKQSDGSVNYLNILTNQPNENFFSFQAGWNLLHLVGDASGNDNTQYFLKVEEIDPQSGSEMGNSFTTERFSIDRPAAAASTSSTSPASATPSAPTDSGSVVSSAATSTLSTSTTALAQTTTTATEMAMTTATTTQMPPTPTILTDTRQWRSATTSTGISSSQSSGLDESDQIALGVGLGVGLPATLATIATLWIILVRGR